MWNNSLLPTRSPRSAAAFLTLLLAGAGLFPGCISKEDPMFWTQDKKDRIHKVTMAELLADFRVEAERIRTSAVPVQRQDGWTTRQNLHSLLRGLNETVPAEMFEVEERVARLGLVPSWYELSIPGPEGTPPRPEFILWIHEPFGQYSGSGMYFVRFPHESKLSAGLPAGFENNALTESAVELFLRTPKLVSLAINTPSKPPATQTKTRKPTGMTNMYEAYIETWLTTGNGVFWLDLCTYPRVPASENLYLGAVTIASNGKNQPLTGRAAEFRRKLLDAGLTVEVLGDGLDLPGLKLPAASAALAGLAKQAQTEYLLLAFPTTAFDKPQQWLDRMLSCLPATRFTQNPKL